MRSGAGTRLRGRAVLGTVLVMLTAAAAALSGCDAAPPGRDPTASAGGPAVTSPPSGAGPSASAQSPAAVTPGTTAQPGTIGHTPGHVFVINLENKGYDKTWGSNSSAPYLSRTLRTQGVLLREYYGIAHNSAPNYLAQISGQKSNEMTRADCPTYEPMTVTGTAALGQVEGNGCVYPASVPTLAGQLSAAGRSWKGYMEDMTIPCEHPDLGAKDDHEKATPTDQYATRHNPFVYFASITSSPDCARNVVNLDQLGGDLKLTSSTPNFSYITPNLCNDGHDIPCADGRPGGLETADTWLQQHVPAILASPAYKEDGVLVITFDESEGQTTGPSGIAGGTDGGKVGALVLSPFTKGGTNSDVPYNHFSLLASIEDMFSLPRLGYAGAPGLQTFGNDVFNAQT